MSLTGATASTAGSPCILVVDDDKRVVDLLNIALAAHGYRVITAGDGEEAVKVAFSRRPDLVVLDVRLPRKSGLEVCELLRQDPEDPHTPIIMVSAASETEARLQGFARGADDYMAKPFSPKELVARIRRLLARSGEAREARRRGREAEVELSRARDDVKRAHQELRREQRLRGLTAGIAREMSGTLDSEALAARFLLEVQTQVGVGVATLLTPDHAHGGFVPVAIRGDGLERVTALEVAAEGGLVPVLTALGRPARRTELERFPELRGEVLGLVAAGFSLIAPLRAGDRLEGILLADERTDGLDVTRVDVDVLALLCDAAAAGLQSARRCTALAERLVDVVSQRAIADRLPKDALAREEAAVLASGAARALALPTTIMRLIEPAVAIGPWALGDAGRRTLGEAAEADPTGRLRDLSALIANAAEAEPVCDDDDPPAPGVREAMALLGFADRYTEARARGGEASDAMNEALRGRGSAVESSVRQALAGVARTLEPRTA